LYHFNPPKVIEAEVFMRLPDNLRRDHAADLTSWARQQHPGVPVAAFLEGPSFDTAGNLYCVDIAHGRIFRTTPNGEVSVVTEYDGEPNGLKIHKDGRIFVADYKNGIVNVDPSNGKVTPVLERARLERFRGVNDLVFASNGDLYFTDQGQSGMHDPSGCVYRLRSNGQIDRILDNVPSPNGVVLNAQALSGSDTTELHLACAVVAGRYGDQGGCLCPPLRRPRRPRRPRAQRRRGADDRARRIWHGLDLRQAR
jgi:gluconolactonase